MTTTTDSPPPAFLYAPDFFRTNRIFTDGDQKLIRQHLDYAEANLLDVQKLMLDVIDEDRIKDLSRQERELVDCIERCRVALAPIKKLPDDILRCIFIICCNSPTRFLSRDSKPSLITLCQVCFAWRSLALETPFLWSHINLTHESWRIYNLPHVEEAVKLWFARASTCPISLEAGVLSYGLTCQERELNDLVGRVISPPSRYKKLGLRISSEAIDILLGKLSPDQLCHLEELETVDVDRPVDAVSPKGLNLPFSPAVTFANLKKLIVTGYWNSNNLSNLLPFPHLQMLNIQTTISLALELFQQCPRLETCEIVMERSDSTTRSWVANSTSYITLPQLRNLKICVLFNSTEDCCHFIDQLMLGNLESLRIFASHETEIRPDEIAEHVVSLSQRSGTPNIRELCFNRKSVPILGLNPGILLRSLPHLEKIVTDGCVTLDEETLDGLAMGTIGRCLSHLHADNIDAKLAAITKMAKQRAQNVELNKLRVTTRKLVLGESGWNMRSDG